jgi:hypothetical protein
MYLVFLKSHHVEIKDRQAVAGKAGRIRQLASPFVYIAPAIESGPQAGVRDEMALGRASAEWVSAFREGLGAVGVGSASFTAWLTVKRSHRARFNFRGNIYVKSNISFTHYIISF